MSFLCIIINFVFICKTLLILIIFIFLSAVNKIYSVIVVLVNEVG